MFEFISSTLMVLNVLLCVPLESTWHLGMNINPCDGHDFGYGGPWADNADVGSADQALTADFLNDTVWNMPVGYVTITRHNEGVCEMSKTWELSDKTKSMYQYFSDYPGRIYATGDGSVADQHIHSDIPDSFEGSTTDPIFAAEGGLVFNWYYSNNGARIAVAGSHYIPYYLPGTGSNTDDVHGLGNEYGGATSSGYGSSTWWHDVGPLSGNCHGTSCSIVGTDHGTAWGSDGPCWGSYAVYVSDSDTSYAVTTPTVDPTTDPTVDPTMDPTVEPTTDPTRCDINDIYGVDWHDMFHGDGDEDDLLESYAVHFDSTTFSLTVSATVEYVGLSADGNTDEAFNLGTTYWIDFQSFAGISGNITTAGSCGNRRASDYSGLSFGELWGYTADPLNLEGALAAERMAYPPSDWTLTSSDCNTVKYEKTFSLAVRSRMSFLCLE